MSSATTINEKNEKMQSEDENIGLSCALERFSEVNEVENMIDNLKNVYNKELSVVEKSYERYLYILDQYHEQPHLLDLHIDKLLNKLCDIARNSENPEDLRHIAFKYLYVIIKVRGYKIVVRHLPHEVSDFEPILRLLESQDSNSTQTWTTRYVLLLWLSILVKIPFHMSRLDDNETQKTVSSRLFDICKVYAVTGDKCRDAAAYLASQFLTRVDIKTEYLPIFLDWACDVVLNKESSVFAVQGALSTIAMILKYGKREDLLPFATKVLRFIINTEYKESPGSQIPKLGFKIVQRIGLIYLKPRIVAWRYQRGNRVLALSLNNCGDNSNTNSSIGAPEEDDNDVDVPEEIEDVIDELMQGLKSTDGVVRWSAAKGIGRVTSRLPKTLADEVVGSILDLFSPRETYGAWHGGCLTLAELGRRGLLLPQRLPEVVPVVVKALVYDEPNGYTSIGSYVRDSACYVAWAFARAYEVNDLQPYVKDIARALLIVTCFDREINCRRAAAAAFQENVGRQGSFPYGIEILTVADFFAVGSRQNAYLSISVFIAQFPEYTKELIDHLVDRKIYHWDSAIRELTAKALHKLTEKAPEYMASEILPKLLKMSGTIDLNARHGSILGIGQIFYALSKIGVVDNMVSREVIEEVRDAVPKFRERLYFRGLGGEILRQACAFFIKKCSQARMPFHDLAVIDDWLALLNECLSYEVEQVRNGAIEALPYFFNEYFNLSNKHEQRDKIIDTYIDNLRPVNKVAQMGHLLALGSMPAFMLENCIKKVIDAIVASTKITEGTLKWAEGRRDALKALTSICNTLNHPKYSETLSSQATKIFECFFTGLNEYTQDNRGDIGAWVRESSLIGLQTLVLNLTKTNPSILTPEIIKRIISGTIQQSVEKIDRTRALAGKVFSSLIHNDSTIPNVPHHENLLKIFPKEDCILLNWNSEAITFPLFVQVLSLEDYTYNLLLGLIVSVGGLTETLVKSSSSALFTYLYKIKTNVPELNRLSNVILQIFATYQKNDRITVPMFRFLEKLFASGCFNSIITDEECDFSSRTLKMIQVEISGCKDIYKLIDGISVLCQYIQVKKVCSTALVQLSILLCHRHTYIRKATSTRLYESILVYGEVSTIPQDNLDQVMTLISETDWEEPVEKIRSLRNELCQLMGVKVPVIKKK